VSFVQDEDFSLIANPQTGGPIFDFGECCHGRVTNI
jgi:hypothetical protein